MHSDYHGTLTDKDVLPAYDVAGGPPKYVEVERSRILQTPVAATVPPAAEVDGSMERASEFHEPESERGGISNEPRHAVTDSSAREEGAASSSVVVSHTPTTELLESPPREARSR